MLQFTPSTSSSPPIRGNDEKRHLARLRRIAKRRGFRILKDWTGTWSLADTRIEPARALIGLWQVGLDEIDAALSMPPPPPKARTHKPKPVKPAEVYQAAPEIVDAGNEPVGPESAEPLSAVEALQEQLDVRAMLEKLRFLHQKSWGR